MKAIKPINLLVVGVGGQGVNALSIALQNTCMRAGLYCKSSIFKGGAQKRGAIYSFIRIFPEKTTEVANYGGEIASSDLDVLLALEYNESIRYMTYYHQQTKLLVNRKEVAFFSKRYHKDVLEVDAMEILQKHFPNTEIIDFSQESKTYFGTEKMLNFVMGIQAIRKAYLPINETIFKEEFIKNISFSTEIKQKMNAYAVAKTK